MSAIPFLLVLKIHMDSPMQHEIVSVNIVFLVFHSVLYKNNRKCIFLLSEAKKNLRRERKGHQRMTKRRRKGVEGDKKRQT